jgi:hypothetical protein
VDFRAGAELYRRGGESDRRLSPAWLVAATIGLGHAAGGEVGADRMSAEAVPMRRRSISMTVPCHALDRHGALDHRGGLGRRDRLPGSG